MRYIRAAVLVIAAVLLAGVLAQPAHAEVSFDLAYSNLSQHGSWLVSAQYGHVWQPREYNPQWNPYYDGHWVYTDMGWTWVSDYQWGGIPYHYGTWVADPAAGWVWIPGNTWAPSWVVFRTGPDYIGWAPVPVGYSVGVSIDLGGSSSFVFVSSRDFLAPRLRASIIPVARTSVFINNTTVVNNIVVQNNVVVNRGPDYRTVEKATGRTIREERIENVARVSPYDHMNRSQLAVDPERARHGVRASEQVPASQPLPNSNKHGNGGGKGAAADAPNIQESATKSDAVTPSGAADTSQKESNKANADQSAKEQANSNAKADQIARAQANADQQHANAQANANAKADQHAKAQADAKANADQQHAKAQADAKANADQQHANAQANANAKADQHARAQATAKAKADANAKAKADQIAKAQANAKAKADAYAKKHNPDKKDTSPGKGTTPEATEGTHQ